MRVKKIYILAFLSLILIVISSCTSQFKIPYGIWRSENPDMELFISTRRVTGSRGVYNRNGEDVDVYIRFTRMSSFDIIDLRNYHYDETENNWRERNSFYHFYRGGFRLTRNGKLYYNVRGTSDGSGDINQFNRVNDTIIFELVEQYIPPPSARSWETLRFEDYRDGRIYFMEKIGGLWWMAENLNHKIGNNWCYDGDRFNCIKYGRLYDLSTALDACPDGWRLPTREEWDNLAEAVRGSRNSQANGGINWSGAGRNLKLRSNWNNSGGGTNEYSFSAMPGGFRDANGTFNSAGVGGFWWTATETANYNIVYIRSMSSDHNDLLEFLSTPNNGYSVRCVSDNPNGVYY